jgi:hypothetical protein
MNWTNFVTYRDGYEKAFETLCTQLFERYLKRTYKNDLIKFRVVNGAGGDGGIEAYGELRSGEIIAVQAKWFPDGIDASRISQMRDSVTTAKSLRSQIKHYYFCVPRNLSSKKFGRGPKGAGKQPIVNSEEKAVDEFTDEIETKYLDLDIRWWFDQDLHLQIIEPENEGIHMFWFGNEIISFQRLINQFDLQKTSWLSKRYVPHLHGQGYIQNEIQQILFNQDFRKALNEKFIHKVQPLQNAIDLIKKLLPTLNVCEFKNNLEILGNNLETNIARLQPLRLSIRDGVDEFNPIKFENIAITDELLDAIQAIQATNTQIGIPERLIDVLSEVRNLNLADLANEIILAAKQDSRLFLGSAGTGKTHALANTVDKHLNNLQAPAIIIRAKGTPSSTWSSILKYYLDLQGWDKNHILSALETLAIRNDHRLARTLKPGKELNQEPSKIVICIDGLEEDIQHWDAWYSRMRDTIHLIECYSRLRFVFSARQYFLDKDELPHSSGFAVKYVPEDGDIPVHQAAEKYFLPENYNIKVNPKSLIRGIDSLFALRLFCMMYSGQELNEKSDIETAEKKLLLKKIEALDTEFKGLIGHSISKARKPIGDALKVISEIFYQQPEVEHNILFDRLKIEQSQYLNDQEIDSLIDFLTNNGILIRQEVPRENGLVLGIRVLYILVHQSIMELIMSQKYSTEIMKGERDRLPSILLTTTKSNGSKILLQ